MNEHGHEHEYGHGHKDSDLKPGDDCPKCGGELEKVIHRYQEDGGAPDCSWLICLDCNFQTEPS